MTTVGLEPTTVETAGAIIARTVGLSWPEDRVQIIEYLNDYRDILYVLYPDLKLFDNAFHCICVSNFPVMCGVPCNGSECYQGFVLPDDIVSVEAAWEHGFPLKIRSRWREAHFGLDNERSPRIAITEMAEQTCTERALQSVTGLKMFAESPDDDGKKVHMEVVMADGTRRTLGFTLRQDGWVVVDQPVRQILSISLPSGRKGNVILAQTDDYQLSLYRPYETVPAYRKFRVANQCTAGAILIQGVKRFVPVSCDYEVVEVGSRTVLLAAGSYLKFKANTTEAKDLKRAAFDKTEMGEALLGVQARHRGNAVQDPNPFAGRQTGVSKILPGYYARR